MKKNKFSKFGITILAIFFAFSMSSCSIQTGTHSHSTKKIPPGHAKKMNGSKSAKKYAPGHNK